MMSRRLPSDGDSSQCDAVPGTCQWIGEQLADARVRRDLSVDDVASRLLLSRGQVFGLEHGNRDAFYGRPYFFRALRRYMALADVPRELLDEVDPTDEFAGLRMTLAFADAPPEPPRAAWVGSLKTVPALVVVVGLLTGAAVSRWMSVAVTIPPPAVEREEPLPSRPTTIVQPPQPSVTAFSAVDLADPARQ